MNVTMAWLNVVRTVRIHEVHSDVNVDRAINLHMIIHPVLVSCFYLQSFFLYVGLVFESKQSGKQLLFSSQ